MKLITRILFLSAILILTGCKGGNSKVEEEEQPNIQSFDTLPDDFINAIGTVGDGTSMNTLELILDEGDTVLVDCPVNDILGGATVGDRLAVTYSTKDEYYTMLTCVNMTSLQHLWTQKGADGTEQSLEINDNGRATTYDMNVEYNGWSLKDGQLLLYSPKQRASEQGAVADTFDIMELTDEHLVLMHGDLTTEFERTN